MSLWPREWASNFAKVQEAVIVDGLRFPTVEHGPQFLQGRDCYGRFLLSVRR